MTYLEYLKGARETATYPGGYRGLTYLKLGLRGEAGEVDDKLKKLIRDCGWWTGTPVPEDRVDDILLELGDVLWYCANYAYEREMAFLFPDREMADEPLSHGDDIISSAISLHRSASLEEIHTCIEDISRMAQMLGSSLSGVAEMNYRKLHDRMERHRIGGSGDHR